MVLPFTAAAVLFQVATLNKQIERKPSTPLDYSRECCQLLVIERLIGHLNSVHAPVTVMLSLGGNSAHAHLNLSAQYFYCLLYATRTADSQHVP